jgi:hypothetical protein
MPRVKLASGALRDQIRIDIFDSLVQDLATSITGITEYFSNVQAKGSTDTNLRLNRNLENQVSYLVQGIGYDAKVRDAADSGILPLFLDHASLKLKIGEKIYWEGALRFITGHIAQEGGFLAQFDSFDNAKYALKGNDSIAIPPLQTFALILEVAGYTAAEEAASLPTVNPIKHYARLLGLQRRPVQ